MNPERRRQIVTRCGLDAIYLHYSERQPGIDPPPPLRFRRNPKRIALLDLRHLVEDACSCQHECYGGRSRNHQDAVDFPATATERAKAAMTIPASSLAGDERSGPGVQAVLHQRTALGAHKSREDRPRTPHGRTGPSAQWLPFSGGICASAESESFRCVGGGDVPERVCQAQAVSIAVAAYG